MTSANALRVIGKRKFDLESDPPPDILVEIDITNESLSELSENRFLPGLTPAMLAAALEQSKTDGQDAALDSFRSGKG